jgi:hypothetical protein
LAFKKEDWAGIAIYGDERLVAGEPLEIAHTMCIQVARFEID